MTAPMTTRRSRRGRSLSGHSSRLWFAWSLLRSVILTSAAVLGIVCVLVFGVSFAFGLRPLIVLSGSMEPTLPVGSVVFSRTVPAAELAVGDIATLERPRGLGLITHRVTSVHDVDGTTVDVTLRGDANATDDPEPYAVDTAGLYVFHVPYMGTVAMVLKTGYGIGFAVASALVLIVVFLLDPHRLRHPQAAPLGGGASPANAGGATTARTGEEGR